MTQIEVILVLTVALAVTWCSIAFWFAIKAVKYNKKLVAYYQHPDTQCQIARHVLKNKWYADGGEVFK